MQDKELDDLGSMLLDASRRLKWHLTGRLGDVGITVPQWMVLNDIYTQEASGNTGVKLTPAAIAERLNIDRPTISGIIERLEKHSWVNRVINPEDRRSYIIMLADKAKMLISELEELRCLSMKEAIKDFDEEELYQLKQYLQRIINNLRQKK